MVRERPTLGTPFGTDGPWLNAIVDVLGDLFDLLDARLPAAVSDSGRPGPQVVPVSEPAPDGPPPGAEPTSEPAPDDLPVEDGPEPAGKQPEPPPRAGRGSGLEAWQAWATDVGVDVPDGASRNDIIAACEAAGLLPAE